MPTRRRMMGYGADEPPHPHSAGHLLPPPDGNPPVRLPIGEGPQMARPQGAPMPQQSQGADLSGDPNDQIIRLLQSLGKL